MSKPDGILDGDPALERIPRLAMRLPEAALALGVSPRLLWTWTKAGLVPHFRLGRSVLYSTEALRKFLEDESRKKKGPDDE